MKRIAIYTLCASMLSGCVGVDKTGPSPEHGFETAGMGLGNLILAPFMVVAGLLEGIASLPFFLAGGVHELNRELVSANAQITMDDVYQGAYGEPLERVPANGDTGTLFREMRSATVHFQSMLKRQGVDDAGRYVLTAVRTADKNGYTLYAVVRRATSGPIHLSAGYGSSARRELNLVDLDYYRPYARDAQGRSLDEVIDWAGLPRKMIATQKGQAILFNLAANSILNNKHSNDYWRVEQRWIAGEFRTIAETRQSQLRARMRTG